MRIFRERFLLFAFLFSLIFVIAVGFSNRSYYFSKFDYEYTRDLFDHSQWTIAKATRIIGDAQLYQVAGHDAVKNGQLYTVAPEVPPLGKYLIGLSIIVFDSPAAISYFLYIFSISLFFLLSRQIFKKKEYSAVATIIFLSEPLIFSQSSFSMLDLPLLTVLLIHLNLILFLIKGARKMPNSGKIILTTFAGISLGAFVGIKIGILGIVILIADLIFLARKKMFFYFVVIFISAGVTYAALYLPYFLQGHSIIDFLRAQKWMVHFYAISKVKSVYGMILISMATSFWSFPSKLLQFVRINEWSILWPVYLLTLPLTVYLKLNKKLKISREFGYIFLCAILFFILLFTIPFWVRYLVILLPFLILIFVYLLPKFDKKLLVLIFVLYIGQVLIFLYRPLYSNQISDLSTIWEKGAYQELYEALDASTKATVSREEFRRNLQSFEKDLGAESKKVSISIYSKPWEVQQQGHIAIEYQTDLGNVSNTNGIKFIREDGLWKIKWDNNLPYEDYENVKVVKNYSLADFGALKTDTGFVLAESGLRPYFFITPGKIEDEILMQKQLFRLTGINKYDQEVVYKANSQLGWAYPLGFLDPKLNPNILDSMKLDPGISYELKETLVYNPLYFKNFKYLKKLFLEQGVNIQSLYPTVGGTIKLTQGDEVLENLIKESVRGKDIVVKDSKITNYLSEP